MALDPNIILQAGHPDVQLANPLDIQQKALAVRQLQQRAALQDQELAQNQAVREAYNSALTQNPDGSVAVDRNKLTGSLLGNGFGQQALQQNQAMTENDLKMAEAKRKAYADQVETGSQLISQVPTDPNVPLDVKQAAWTKHNQDAVRLGMPNADQLPAQYPGDQVVNTMKYSMMTADKQLTQHNKEIELQTSRGEANAKRAEAGLPALPEIGAAPKQGGTGSPKGPSAETDPAVLVRARVPQKLQPKAFDEIQAAQNTSQNAPKILEAFDNAANNIHAADFVPGMDNADQKALHALLGPTFKDVEGTVRQAAMDNMNKNVTPQFGDDKNTIKTKRAALEAYLQSKSAAPTLKGFGIDLKKFKSTNYSIGESVQMRDPKGNIRMVPRDLVDAAKAAGGQEI